MSYLSANESLQDSRHSAVGAWFFGPKAENVDYLKAKIQELLDNHHKYRQTLYPNDKAFINKDMRETGLFKEQLDRLDKELDCIGKQLRANSVPFWSPRYNAHMSMETTMPSLIGYLLGLFHNQNNVALEASPMTTIIEGKVGVQLCTMLGYGVPPDVSTQQPNMPLSCPRQVYGWGHITCDGSVANLEAIWAARNLKFYPLSLQLAIKEDGDLKFLSSVNFSIELCNGRRKQFIECDTWELLNLKPSTVLNIPQELYDSFGVSQTALGEAMEKYSVQSLGLDHFLRNMDPCKQPQLFVTTTRHYSWPKGAALVGIGRDNTVSVAVDDRARLDIQDLDRKLGESVREKRAVYAVIAIIGSTEHGAIDPLENILALRKKYEQLGLSFIVHCDAAWGGYFTSTLRDRAKGATRTGKPDYVPIKTISPYTKAQLNHIKWSDSVTIDPHKSGYCPYPAGGLCYRDMRMRYLVTWTSPIVYRESDQEDSIGVYGVEGSKPGAAAVGAYLSHNVLGLDKDGYGTLLGEAILTSTRLYCQWATMEPLPIAVDVGEGEGKKTVKGMLRIEPFNALPAGVEDIKDQKQFIRERILSKDNKSMMEDQHAVKLLQQLGSDLMINAFACNFEVDSQVNQDILEANYLNGRIFNQLSYTMPNDNKKISDISLFLTSTVMPQKQYGKCLTKFKSRLGLKGDQDLYVLVNVTMNPWATTHHFVQELADSFQKVALNEMRATIKRNVESRDKHGFILQDCGNQTVCGVHLPMFNKENHRKQLIISGKIKDENKYKKLVDQKSRAPQMYFSFGNNQDMTLSELLERRTFAATLQEDFPWKEMPFAETVEITDVKMIFERSLRPSDQPMEYPQKMLFLVYSANSGDSSVYHMDHLLTRAPNIQLNSENIRFPDESHYNEVRKEEKWWFRLIDVNEAAMQPLIPDPDNEDEKKWFEGSYGLHFVPLKEFQFEAFEYGSLDALLGINKREGESPRARFAGKVQLGASVFADYTMLNEVAHEPAETDGYALQESQGHHSSLIAEHPVPSSMVELRDRLRSKQVSNFKKRLDEARLAIRA